MIETDQEGSSLDGLKNLSDDYHEPVALTQISTSDEDEGKSHAGSSRSMSRVPTQQEMNELVREGTVDAHLDKELQDTPDELKFLVTFDVDDPERPINWAHKKKLYHTAVYGITTFCAQFGSAIMSPLVSHLSAYFHISTEVAILPTSFYILGIAFGPMCFAPVSEMYGRKVGVYLPMFISTMMSIGAASVTTTAGIMLTRFFAGFFAGAPVVSSGGVLADIWHPAVRGTYLVFYAFFVVCGAVFAPIFGSLITKNGEKEWRWALWLCVIINFVVIAVGVLTLSESYAPVLLKKKARDLRISTRNWAYHAKHDEWNLDLREFFTVHCLRPFAMLATPIVLVVALFASYVFGILYLVITGISYVFEVTYGMGYVARNLPLISLFIGCMCGGTLNVLYNQRYARLVMANDGKPLPEERMKLLMYVAWLMPAGIFIFSWTSYHHVHWIAPCIGIFVMAAGFFVIFQGCLNYLVDTFSKYAASAIAANTFLRSVFAAAFPLFGRIMFHNLGNHWGGSILAFIALGMIPIPYVFYFFGTSIRKRNPYAKLVS